MTFNKFYSDLHIKTKTKIEHQKSNNMNVDGKLYSLDGEYIGDKFNVEYKLKLSDKQIESFKSKNEMYEHEKDNGGFIFLFYQLLQSMDDQLPNLNKPDMARLLYLSTFVQFDTNKITHDNGRNIKDDDLAEMLKFKPRQYKAYIKKLVDNGYMTIDIDGYKVLSPYLCKYGKLDNKWLKKHNISHTRLFKGTVRNIFEKANSRELNKISIIYMILPYVSLKYNIVCSNPSEIDDSKVKPYTLKDLTEILGYSNPSVLKNYLHTVKVNDESVFWFLTDSKDVRKFRIILDTNVIFAGDLEQLKLLNVWLGKNK